MHRSGLTLLINLFLLVLPPALALARQPFILGLSFPQPDAFYKTASGWVLEGEIVGSTGPEKALLKELNFYIEGKRVAQFHDVPLVNGRAPFKLLLKDEAVGVLPVQLYADGLYINPPSLKEQLASIQSTFGCDARMLEPPLAELLRVRVDNRKDAEPELTLVGHLPWLSYVRGEYDRDEPLGPAGLLEYRLDFWDGLAKVSLYGDQIQSPGAWLRLELELTPVILQAPATFDLAKQTAITFSLRAGQARITLHDPDRDILVADLGRCKADEKTTTVTWDGKPTRPYKWVDELGRVRAGQYEVRVGWKAPEWRKEGQGRFIATGSVYGRATLEVHNPSAPPRPEADKPPAPLSPTLRLATVGLPLAQFNQFAFQEEKRRKENEASRAAGQAEYEEYRTSHFWLPTWMTLLVCLLSVLLIVKLLFAPARPPAGKPTEPPKSDHPEGGEDQ